MCAKHYENPTMLSRVTTKMLGMFLRHSVDTLRDSCGDSLWKPGSTYRNAFCTVW